MTPWILKSSLGCSRDCALEIHVECEVNKEGDSSTEIVLSKVVYGSV